MPDPGREVPLKVGDATYILYGGNRALRMIERDTGKSVVALFSEQGLAEIGVGTLTSITWALLTRHHPDLTVDDVDDIIDDAGYDKVMDAIGKALEHAFPDAKAQASAANGAKPGKPRRGTGMRS